MVSELAEEFDLNETITLLDAEFKRNGVISSRSFALQVILNIISMCVYPFIMKPLISELSGKMDKDWDSLMIERKDFLKTVVIGSFTN